MAARVEAARQAAVVAVEAGEEGSAPGGVAVASAARWRVAAADTRAAALTAVAAGSLAAEAAVVVATGAAAGAEVEVPTGAAAAAAAAAAE